MSFAPRLLCMIFLGFTLAVGLPLSADITGTVVDSSGDPDPTPVEGAIVLLQNSEIQTVTDADGAFTLETEDGTDLVICAAGIGFFNGAVVADDGDVDVEISLDPVDPDSMENEDYTFLSPPLCGFCHEDHQDDHELSPMSQTGLNTWLYDLYNGTGPVGDDGDGFVYTVDSVHADDDPEADCAACHQPQQWLQEGGDAAIEPFATASSPALNGVSCDICHKISNVDVEKIMWPGVDEEYVTVSRPDAGVQVQYGVLRDSDFVSSTMRGAYNPQLKSEVCGVCHEETFDPNLKGEYDGPDAVPVQTTYSEWAASDYGDPDSDSYTSCAGCHMPSLDSDDDVELCNVIIPPLLRPAETYHVHDVQGANADFLENALTMEVMVEDLLGETIVTVDIINEETGHSVPTGIPERHMVLLVHVATDAGDDLEYVGDQLINDEGGVGDPDDGYFEGLPGKVFARVLEDADGNAPVFYTEATAETYDTRVAAGETDTTVYSFANPAGGATVDVTVSLIYRRAYLDVIADNGWEETGLGVPLEELEEPYFGHLMESYEETLVVTDAPDPEFLRGDGDGNGVVFPILDALYLLEFSFNGGPAPQCEDAGDANDSGSLQLLIDPLYLLNYAFAGGPAPPDPGLEECGADPTDDGLGCEEEADCP